MSDQPTADEVKASIVPKSDQLNADDLVTGPITVTITGVKRGDREQPIVVEIEGHQPYKPCKTMRRVLIASFSDDAKAWVGEQMTLYCDPDVTWAGVKVGGIRISHLSGIDEPRTFLITKGRGKRSEVVVYPVDTLSPSDAKAVAEYEEELTKADTEETLRAIGLGIRNQPSIVRKKLKPIYETRLEQLRQRKEKDDEQN